MSAVGPLGRSAADLRIALAATAGPATAAQHGEDLAPPRHRRLSDIRVGVVLDHPAAPVSSDVGARLADAVDDIARAGVKVVQGWPDGIDPVRESESFGFHVGLFFAAQEPGSDFASEADIAAQQERRLTSRAAWSAYFESIDVFLCPANFTAAFPHDARPFEDRTISTPEGLRPYDSQPFWISHASLPGLPAVVAPIGLTPDGLPVGAQIIGPLGEDDTAITFAELLADVIGGFTPPRI
jgi:amidase